MTRNTFNYTHADTGNKPPSSLNFDKNERPQADKFDWYWYNVIEAIKGHADEFNRLDSDNDGIVDEADSVSAGGRLKGDLTASDGEAIWDESANYIPKNRLQNDSFSIAGKSISLGESVSFGLSDLGDFDASGADKMTLPKVSATPNSTSPGDIWYREDLD